MGTRNLTKVIYQGETRIAQYGQWDGYPSGQGATVVEFIRKRNLDKFKEKLLKCKWVTKTKQKEIDEYAKKIGSTDGWMTMEQAAQYKSKYPLFSRDNGAGILEMVEECEDKTIWLYDNSDFVNDGVFCEWAYVIDLDDNVLQVHAYGKKIKSYKIDKLPTVKTFVKQLEKIAYHED